MAVMRTRLRPKKTEVNRSTLRQEQSAILAKAVGRHIVVVKARAKQNEKCIVDRRYFQDLLDELKSSLETLEITTDTRLFAQLIRSAETIDEDVRLGRLHSLEEAFE